MTAKEEDRTTAQHSRVGSVLQLGLKAKELACDLTQ